MGLLGPRVGSIFDRFGGRPLVIPGATGVVLALGVLTQISTGTPYWLVMGVHVVMMTSLALLFTPVFTLGLGDVPTHLYSHASSMLGAVQQVAGALGTALVITISTSRAEDQVAAGIHPLECPLFMERSLRFCASAGLSVAVLALAVRLPTGRPQIRRPRPNRTHDKTLNSRPGVDRSLR